MNDTGTSGPNWTYWNAMPSMEIWKVVALSLNIDIQGSTIHQVSLWHPEFKTRMDLVIEAIANGAIARPGEKGKADLVMVVGNTPDYSKVRVSVPEFVCWAASVNLSIPLEMQLLDNHTEVPPSKGNAKKNLKSIEEKELRAKERRSLHLIIGALAEELNLRRDETTEKSVLQLVLNRIEQLGCYLDRKAASNHLEAAKKTVAESKTSKL